MTSFLMFEQAEVAPARPEATLCPFWLLPGAHEIWLMLPSAVSPTCAQPPAQTVAAQNRMGPQYHFTLLIF